MYLFDKERSATAQTMSGATLNTSLDEDADYSALLLRFSWTADSSQIDAKRDQLIDWITGINVIGDDDKYIINNRGRQLAALAFYRTGHVPQGFISNVNDSVNTLELPIFFGRYLGDPEYFLKGGQFDSLELNVTNGDSDTGNHFDAGTLEIHELQLKDHNLTPNGFLRSKEILNPWTPSSSTSSKTTKLPDKYLIEKILIDAEPTYTARTSQLTSELDTLINEIKLTYNGGDVVVYDDDLIVLARRNAAIYGRPHVTGIATVQSGDDLDTHLGLVEYAKMTELDTMTTGQTPPYFDSSTTQKQTVMQVNAADINTSYEAIGLAYMDSVIFDYQRKHGEMDMLLDPNLYKKVELELTAGSVSGTQQISVVEVVPSL